MKAVRKTENFLVTTELDNFGEVEVYIEAETSIYLEKQGGIYQMDSAELDINSITIEKDGKEIDVSECFNIEKMKNYLYEGVELDNICGNFDLYFSNKIDNSNIDDFIKI
jgi:hypothetical protein